MSTRRLFVPLVLICLFVASTGRVKAQSPAETVSSVSLHLQKGSEVLFSISSPIAKQAPFASGTGNLLLSNNKFRLRYQSLDVCYNGEQLSYYDYRERTLTLLPSNNEEIIQLNPILLLRGGENFFVFNLLSSRGNEQNIELIPKNNRSLYQRIVVTLDAKRKTVSTIDVEFRGGETSHITITKIIPRSDLSSNYFVQKEEQYPNSELVDLR